MSGEARRLGWGHININVGNLDRSIEFYRKLGFEAFLPGIPYLDLDSGERARRLPDDAARALGLEPGTRGRACIMQLGSGFPKIDLVELADVHPRRPAGNADLGIVRICLASRDLQRDCADLRDQGVEFLSEPVAAWNAMADIAVCLDPDGTLIELIEVHPDRWRPPRRE